MPGPTALSARNSEPVACIDHDLWPPLARAPHPVPITGPIVQSTFFGTANNDSFTGTGDPDVFFMGDGGKDKVTALAGNDQIFFDAAFAANDKIDGGDGTDILTLEGDYSGGVVFTAATVTNVETIQLAGSFQFDLTLHEDTVGAGQSCTITGGPAQVSVDASADSDATLIKLVGWTGEDTLLGGAGVNILQGRNNADFMNGGGGNDTFVYSTAMESTSFHYDTIEGFDFRNTDLFDLWFEVDGIDGNVTSGALSVATFDTDLAGAVNGAELGAHNALIFRPNSGDLDGELFLIVDVNGTAGYQNSADLVIHMLTPVHMNKINAADFI